MKNDLFSANIDRLYAAAKEKHGERAEAALTDAVRKTAGKFKKLGEKAYITALLQELGVGAFYQVEERAPEGLTPKLETAFEEGLLAAKKKGRKYALLGGAVAVCFAVVGGFVLRGPAPSGATTIEGAKEYASGDFVLTNVHTVNDYIDFDGEYALNLKARSKYQTASTVAPNGTVYLLTVCDTKVEEEIDTVGLYQMTSKGWEPLCEIEQNFITRQEGTYTSKYTARNFIFCDSESTPFLFLYDIVTGKLTAHIYNRRTRRTEVVAELSVDNKDMYEMATNIVAVADCNNVYFASTDGGGWVTFLVFNFESQKFQQNGEIMKGNAIQLNAITHREDYTYLLVAESSYTNGDTVYLYSIKHFAEDTQELIFEKQLFSGAYGSLVYPTEGGDVLADHTGRVYAFYAFRKNLGSPGVSTEYALDVLSEEGKNLISERYKPIKNSFDACSHGIFMGPEETIYFIEGYGRSIYSQLTVGIICETTNKKIQAVASFNAVHNPVLLQPQYVSNPTVEEGLFVDLLGVSQSSETNMLYGYMRLQLK